jgi:hypothetical protein
MRSVLAFHTAATDSQPVQEVIEIPVFDRYASDIWTMVERDTFIAWIANNPLAGDLIPGTGGLRKVRWSRAGMGKRSGARVIY